MKFLIVTLTIIVILYETQAAIRKKRDIEEVASTGPASQGRCKERICSRVYTPLCVSVDGAHSTFASRCQLSNFRCKSSNSNVAAPIIRVVHDGSCQQSNIVGSAPARPISQGRCKQRICSRIYTPLCVSVDGAQATFASRCQLSNFRCRSTNSNVAAPIIRVVHDGSCDESYETN